MKGDDVRLGFLTANIGKISSNEEIQTKLLNLERIKRDEKTNIFQSNARCEHNFCKFFGKSTVGYGMVSM